jgi:hypothetical protein
MESRRAWVVVWATFVCLAVIFGVSYSFAAFFENFAKVLFLFSIESFHYLAELFFNVYQKASLISTPVFVNFFEISNRKRENN